MVSDFKKKKKQSLWLHLGGIAIILIFIVLVIANINMYQKKKAYLAQVASLQRQIEDFKSSNEHLKENINESDNPSYIEKVAREELDLQKEGEQVVSFILPKPENQENKTPINPIESWWRNTWNWITSQF